MARKTVRQRFPKAIFKKENVEAAKTIAERGGAVSATISEDADAWTLTIVWDPDA